LRPSIVVGDSVPRKATTMLASSVASQAWVLSTLKSVASSPSRSLKVALPAAAGR